MLGGSLLIAALAIAVDLVLSLFQRLFLTPGAAGQSRRSQQAAADLTDPVLTETVVQGGKP
jgi:osmoprotectant transport system permease protein